MNVILLSVLAVAMKPGSKVNTPCSLVRLDMSSASGPMVPVMAFSGLVFPVARFLSSYFVLMRYYDGDGFGSFRPRSLARSYIGIKGAAHRRATAGRRRRARSRARTLEIRARNADEEATGELRLSPLPHTS